MTRFLTLTIALATGLAPLLAQDTTNFATLGKVHRLDPALDEILPPDARIELLAAGFEWAEGPLWIKDAAAKNGGYLIFSDIPRNSVMKWEEGIGISLFMKPSGYTGITDYGKEPGCNGLALDPQGRILFCEHGDRRVSVLTKDGGKLTLADRYEGKRLNSPNDLVVHSSGAIYFTDPPFGLPNRHTDPRRELDYLGVFRLATDGKLTLLTKELPSPNGLAFAPDERILYVANSARDQAHLRAYPVKEDGTLGEAKVFIDLAKEGSDPAMKGGCDGLKVDAKGNVFATGPGGVWIISPEGKRLGRLETGERTANVAWGNDGSVLYLAADMYLCRVITKTKGAGW